MEGMQILEIRILRRIFWTKRDEDGKWRRPHDEELHSLYRLPNIVRVMKTRRLRLAGYVVRIEEGRSALKILTGKLISKSYVDLCVNGKTIFGWILNK